jgi:hypothetical protein
MKHKILATILAATGSVVLAQQNPKAGVPVAGAPAMATVPSAAGSFQTNDIGHLDIAKLQAIFAELGSINNELRPQEQNIQLNDVDLKVLLEKKYAAQRAVLELENQRRELIDRKLSTDPKFAALVARRLELQQTLKNLRSAMSPMTTARENHMGYEPRKLPPLSGAQPLRSGTAPATVSASAATPANVPVADTPAGQPK